MIDPAWAEADFERLWAFVERHRLSQAGFTILTPLPGHGVFRGDRARACARARWSQFDMHHLLWEPRLGVAALLRAVLRDLAAVGAESARARRTRGNGLAQAKPRHWLHLLQVLRRTQRMMQPPHYVQEHRARCPSRRMHERLAQLEIRI